MPSWNIIDFCDMMSQFKLIAMCHYGTKTILTQRFFMEMLNLRFDDDVAESAVCGIPDELKGESIIAFIVLKESSTKSNQILKTRHRGYKRCIR